MTAVTSAVLFHSESQGSGFNALNCPLFSELFMYSYDYSFKLNYEVSSKDLFLFLNVN